MDNNESDWDQFVITDEQPTIKVPIKRNFKNNKIKKESPIKEIPSDYTINDAIKDSKSTSYLDLLYSNSYFFRKILFSLCYFTVSIYNK